MKEIASKYEEAASSNLAESIAANPRLQGVYELSRYTRQLGNTEKIENKIRK